MGGDTNSPWDSVRFFRLHSPCGPVSQNEQRDLRRVFHQFSDRCSVQNILRRALSCQPWIRLTLVTLFIVAVWTIQRGRMTSSGLNWLGDERLNKVGLGVMGHVGPFQIHWKAHPNLCWDAVGEGERIRLWNCQTSPTRFFAPQQSEGTVRWVKHTSMCLDFRWGLARISNCDGNHRPAVSFRFSADFRTEHGGRSCGNMSVLPWSAVCLGVPSGGRAGSNLSLVHCKTALPESVSMCLKGVGLPLLAPALPLPGPPNVNSVDVKMRDVRVVWRQHPTRCWTLGPPADGNGTVAGSHKVEIKECPTNLDYFYVRVDGFFGPIKIKGRPHLCLKASGDETVLAMPCSSSFTGNSLFSLNFNASTSGCINPELRPDLCLGVNNGSAGSAAPYLDLRHCQTAAREDVAFSIQDTTLSGTSVTVAPKLTDAEKRAASAMNPTDETEGNRDTEGSVIPLVPQRDNPEGAADLPEYSVDSNGDYTFRSHSEKPKKHSKTAVIVFGSCLGAFIFLFMMVFCILSRCSGQPDDLFEEEARSALRNQRRGLTQCQDTMSNRSDGSGRSGRSSVTTSNPKSTLLQPTLAE